MNIDFYVQLVWLVIVCALGFWSRRQSKRYEIEIAKLFAEKLSAQVAGIQATASYAAHMSSALSYIRRYRTALLCIRDNELSAEGCQIVARKALAEPAAHKQKAPLPTGNIQ